MSRRWEALVAEVQLKPLFPIDSFVPSSGCPHKTRIRRGSVFVCMTCHQSGHDHRILPGEPIGSRIDPDYPVDAVTTVYAPEADEPATETRRQKRAKRYSQPS